MRVENTKKAIASTIDGEARYVFNNPYEGGKMVVAEASATTIFPPSYGLLNTYLASPSIVDAIAFFVFSTRTTEACKPGFTIVLAPTC